MAEQSVNLKELLAPTASAILNEGLIVKDEQYSLWLFAQDAFSWQNWMNHDDRQFPFEGDPTSLFYEVGETLNLSRDVVVNLLARADTESAIPSCVFKGNEEDGNGDVAAWLKLSKLQPNLTKEWPDDIAHIMSSRSDGFRRKTETLAQQSVQAEDKPQEPIEEAYEKSSSSPLGTKNLDQHQLDVTLANIGRKIAATLGNRQNNQIETQSQKTGYRIVINISDNTMRIYDRERSSDPILIDRNGDIDHTNSQVLSKDITHFKKVENAINQIEQTQKSTQLEQ